MLVNTKNDSDKPRADSVLNKKRVLEVAVVLFNKRGIETTLEEIAKEAHVGIGTVYRHFPTKHALFESVIRVTMLELIETAQFLRTAKDPGTALLEFMLHMAHSAKLKHSLVDALALTEETASSHLQDVIQTFDTNFIHLVANAQKAGAIRTDLTATDIRTLLAGCVLASKRSQITDISTLIQIVYKGISTSDG